VGLLEPLPLMERCAGVVSRLVLQA